MSMLPIFMIGVILGVILSYAWYAYKKDTPSEIKLKLQEAEIIRYKSDIEIQDELINKLYEEIAELKK